MDFDRGKRPDASAQIHVDTCRPMKAVSRGDRRNVIIGTLREAFICINLGGGRSRLRTHSFWLVDGRVSARTLALLLAAGAYVHS